MNCKFIQNNLIFYVENGLPEANNNRIKVHLDSCKECSRLFSEISETYNAIETKEEIEERAFFTDSVLNKIRQEDELLNDDSSIFDNLFSKYFREIAYSGMALILVLFIIYYISEGTSLFSFMQDNDFLSSDNLSVIFFD
jgi:hypothetical protein